MAYLFRRYASFRVRCWTLDDGDRRIKIEHIQSGDTITLPSLAAALEWLKPRWNGPNRGQPGADFAGEEEGANGPF
jgi:hypothetical protein